MKPNSKLTPGDRATEIINAWLHESQGLPVTLQLTRLLHRLVEGIAEAQADAQDEQNAALRTTLLTILDQVDYTAGNCRPNEMVGAVLPKELIVRARATLSNGPATDA